MKNTVWVEYKATFAGLACCLQCEVDLVEYTVESYDDEFLESDTFRSIWLSSDFWDEFIEEHHGAIIAAASRKERFS